jgi:hypothetical protein
MHDQGTPTVLTWSVGGLPSTYRPVVAGRFGCDPCWRCGRRPRAGERVWSNNYGDLYCDGCARRLAAAGVPAGGPDDPDGAELEAGA